jgi:LmbE family N-acetylglucosaminyl deacetylase
MHSQYGMNQKGPMNMEKARILAFGAHPDDGELKLGGSAALWALSGHVVMFVSVTNGDTGHHNMGGGPLARRRQAEAKAAAEVAGIESLVLDNHNGELMPTIENRKQIIKVIREFKPDLIITHREIDYHPDHRYTSQLVQDAAYIVTVPNMVALTPALDENPIFAFFQDDFSYPYPFVPSIAIDITDTIETKIDMIHAHESQTYEWSMRHKDNVVPEDDNDRRIWLAERMKKEMSKSGEKYRDLLINIYGEDKGRQIKYAEAIQISELGSPLTPEKKKKIFPFLP